MSIPYHSQSSSSSRSHPQATRPSKVLHFRNVQSPITEADILEFCQRFGPVENIMMLSHADQAFVQFQSQEVATSFLSRAQSYPPKIHDKILYVQYSVHDSIQRHPTARPEGTPSKVLLVTILNPLYTITIDVLSKIFSPYEEKTKQIEKIIIFQRRSNLQSLIQFSQKEYATAALRNLNGKNIYKGCCLLQIQYSKQDDLTIAESSDHSYDFTNPAPQSQKQKPLLPSTGLMNSFGMGPVGFPNYAQGIPGMMNMGGMGMGAPMSGGMMQPFRTVVIVNGFPSDNIGCDQLFNLFSNYGNIVRIKILYDKPNTALIQFTEPIMAANAVQYLKDVPVYGTTLTVNFSKLIQILPAREVREALASGKQINPTQSDGRASQDGRTVEYEESSLNRFTNRTFSNSLKHLTAPTQFIHVSNLASTVNEHKLSALIEPFGKPAQVKIFEAHGHLMAIIQFTTIEQAVNTMCFRHNELLEGKRIRLSFTKSRI